MRSEAEGVSEITSSHFLVLQQKTPGPLDNPGEARVLVVAEREICLWIQRWGPREKLNWIGRKFRNVESSLLEFADPDHAYHPIWSGKGVSMYLAPNLAPDSFLCHVNRKQSTKSRDICTSPGEKYVFLFERHRAVSWADWKTMCPSKPSPGGPELPPHWSPHCHPFALDSPLHKTRILLKWDHSAPLLKPPMASPQTWGKVISLWWLSSPMAATLAFLLQGLCSHSSFYLKSPCPQNFSWLSSSPYSGLRKIFLA